MSSSPLFVIIKTRKPSYRWQPVRRFHKKMPMTGTILNHPL